MRSEWAKIPISNVCKGIYDGPHATPRPSNSGAIFLGISNFVNGRLDLSNIRYIAEDDLPKWTKRITPQAHDIVFSYEATLNLYAIIPDGFRGCLGRRMALMRPNEDVIDYRYLYYFMFSNEWRREIEKHKILGSTVDRIPLITFPSFTIDVPTLFVQQQIADILSAIDSKITNLLHINDNLEQQIRVLFTQFLTKTSAPSVDDSLTRLGDIATIQTKAFNPAKESEMQLELYSIPAYDDGKYPVYELSTDIKSNKFLVDRDCVLISKLNPTTKRVWRPYCIAQKAVCSTEYIVYKAKDHSMADYLAALIDSEGFTSFMCSHVTGSTNSRQRTPPSETLKYEISLPSMREIVDFSSTAHPIYEILRCNAIEIHKLKSLRDSLLPKLMSGEIDVSSVKL